MEIPIYQWDDYWRKRMKSTGAWWSGGDRFDIMAAQLDAYRMVVIARDMRPEDLEKYSDA